jgi:protein-S-isoprenylcysteine O-methyltransferase Ste14
MPPYGDGNIVALGAAVIAWIGLGSAMLASRRSRASEGAGARRNVASIFGIVLQGIGIGAAWYGPIHVPRSITQQTWIEGAPAALLALSGLGLFVWAAAAMGANWSLVARTRSDHELVQSGPFALVRHPIYLALLLLTIAVAMAAGHAWNLIVAVPLYVIGTLSRIGIEERLLKEAFGPRYEDYARRVKRFVPGII